MMVVVIPKIQQEQLRALWNFSSTHSFITWWMSKNQIFLPPNLKKFGWHIAFGLSFLLFFSTLHCFVPFVTFQPCTLGFWNSILYMDSLQKNSWSIFFSCLSYAPFWSYTPLKKWDGNLVCNISQKVFELGPWYLVYWLGLRSRLTSDQIV